jgi:hypothetical protein
MEEKKRLRRAWEHAEGSTAEIRINKIMNPNQGGGYNNVSVMKI